MTRFGFDPLLDEKSSREMQGKSKKQRGTEKVKSMVDKIVFWMIFGVFFGI